MLTGRYDKDNLPAGPRGLLFRSILPGIEPLTDLMRQIAASRRKTVSQVREIYCVVYMCMAICSLAICSCSCSCSSCNAFLRRN